MLFVFTITYSARLFHFMQIGPPRVFLEHYVFPILLPAMEEMLRRAKEEKCFEVIEKQCTLSCKAKKKTTKFYWGAGGYPINIGEKNHHL